jgi:hypothetical protein
MFPTFLSAIASRNAPGMTTISSMPSLICDSPAVNGEKPAGRYLSALSATFVMGERSMTALLSPFYGERSRQAGEGQRRHQQSIVPHELGAVICLKRLPFFDVP